MTESSGTDSGPSSGKRSNRNRKGKEIRKVKVEDDDQKQIMKSIQESLEAIKVNLADNRKPRRIVPTSRANVCIPDVGRMATMPANATKGRRSRCISSIRKPEYTTPFRTKRKNWKPTRSIEYNRCTEEVRV